MAKRLICSILVDVLGTYVEGLSAENLNLGVLSGKVEMNNLQLKKSGLDGLDLPITIEHGSLKKLRLKIPWTALDSKPVRVYLDGVYLQAGPLDISSLSPEDLARMNTAQRRQKLKAAEDAVVTASKAKDAETNKEKAQELSYFQQFGLKIVDNIEIVLTNVHIRYEDSTTFPGKTFSAGVTIDSISLVTTDSNWNEAFVARDFTAAAIQKLGRLENLGLYWNTDCPPLAPLPNNAWEEAMQEMIFKSSWDHRRASASQFREQPLHQRSPKESGLMYLLGVPNNLYVKITHTEACTATTPKINVDIEVSSLELELDKLQYQQLMATIGSFGMLERQKQLAMMRPSKRPTVCPRDWWFYAYKLITGRDISSGGPFEVIVKCMRFRRRYMDLVKVARLANGGGTGTGLEPPPNVVFGPREEYEMARIEELVPLCALLVFRQLAMAELVQEEKWRADREASKRAKKQKSNPVTRFFASRRKEKEKAGVRFDRWSRQEAEEDELIMDIIQSKLSVNMPTSGDEQFILKLSVLNCATIRLTNDRTPTALLEVALAFRTVVHTSSTVLSFVLEDFQVLDECTQNPLNPYLIVARRDVPTHRHYSTGSKSSGKMRTSPRISDTPDEKLKVVIETTAAKSALKITAQPIEITWNELCVQRILAIFMPRSDGASPVLLTTMNKIAFDAAMPVAGDMEMIIEIDAPKIVVPDDCHTDKGCLLIDGGYLVVKGSVGEVNLVFDISLTAVNVGMPHSLEERYKQNVYLVKPFDIKLNIQNIDKTVADQTLVLDISPSLSADLDSEKIRRLINLIMIIVNTCTKAFDEPPSEPSGADSSTNLYLPPGELDTVDNMSVIDVLSPANRAAAAAADKRLFDMTLFLTSISVHLQLSEKHSVQLLISSLGAHIINHPHDSEMVFSVGSLKLIDSMRHHDQADIIWTPAARGDRKAALVKVTYIVISSRQSPLYRHHGTELRVEFDRLGLNIDDQGVLRLKPFFESLGAALADISGGSSSTTAASDSAPQEQIQTRQSRVTSELTAMDSSVVKAYNAPVGMWMSFTVGAISLTLMRRNKIFANAHPDTHTQSPSRHNSHSSRHLHTQSPTRERRGTSHSSSVARTPRRRNSNADHVEYPPPTSPRGSSLSMAEGEWLEAAFIVEVNGFSCDIDIKELVTTDVRLRLFNIRDTREASKSYEYREMITRSTLASEHNSSATASGDNGQNLTADEVNELANGANGIGRSQDLLTVIYREESKSNGAVDIVLRDVAAFISIDAVIEVVDVIMEMVNAVMGVIGALYVTPADASKESDAYTEDARTASGGRVGKEKGLRRGGVNALTDGSSDMNSPDTDGRTGLRSREMNSRTKTAIAKRAKRRSDAFAASSNSSVASGGRPSPSRKNVASRFPYKKIEERQAKPKVEEVKPASCINVVVSVVNPRILLLEDPENANSRAIIARTSASVHYCNDITAEETRETIHVSLQTLEIFALTGLLEGRPQQIVEPFGIEVHVSRRIIEEIVISTAISADIDTILAKVSIKDIALAQSIASRANIAATKKEKSSSATNDPFSVDAEAIQQQELQHRYKNAGRGTPDRAVAAKSAKVKDDKEKAQENSLRTVYDLVVQLGMVSVTAMNDYEGLSVPVLRAQLEHANFRANGLLVLGDYKGEGALTISADFYNTRVAAWEPVIEKWNPSLAMNSDSCKGTIIAICNDSTLQVNVAGSMVRGLTHYINILISLFDPNADADSIAKAEEIRNLKDAKEVDSPIMFSNQLEYPVTIFDSITGNKLVDAGAGETAPLSLPGSTARSWIQSQASLPTYFDVKVLGKLRDERLPLVQLPLNVNKPRPYYLQPTVGLNKTRNIGIEPIVEEVYENQRFDLTRWSKPWTHMGDPPEWTDASGLVRRDLDSIKLPNDKWIWIESGWKVDRSGIVGKEIDEDGWEYATNFTSFNVSKKRRVQQPMDVARRRRWYRTRAPKNSHLDDVTRPLTIIWDVKTRKNGSRLATIRSGLEVVNVMPFPISIAVFGLPSEGGHSDGIASRLDKGRASFRSDSIQMFEKIPENGTFYVPLMLSHASFMKVRPSRPGFEWSQPISCRGNVSLSNSATTASSAEGGGGGGGSFSEEKESAKMAVENLNGIVAGTYSLMCESQNENDIYIRAILNQAEKSRAVLLAPHVFLRNHLPCNMGYNCICEDGRIENGILRAGATAKLAFVHFSHRLLVSVKVHGYAWSVGNVVNWKGQSTQTVDLQVLAADEIVQASAPVGMSLMMHTTFNEHGAVDIRFFSRFALLDKTGLQLSVRTKRGGVNPDGNVIEKILESGDFNSTLIDRRTFTKWEEALRQQVSVPTSVPASSSQDLDDSAHGLGVGGDLEDMAKNCWAVGANGMVLFHSEDNKASIGVHRGAAWCENLSLVSFGAAKAPFEVVDAKKNIAYQLAYFTTQLPGVFSSTQVVTIIPGYCIVNCLDEPIELKQVLLVAANNSSAVVAPQMPGLTAPPQQKSVVATAVSAPTLSVNPKSCKGWHKADATRGTTVQLRCASSSWSVGVIDVNEIGSTVMILPRRYNTDADASNSKTKDPLVDPFKTPANKGPKSSSGKEKKEEKDVKNSEEDFIVVHVEVRFADYNDLSYVNVVIWREKPDNDGNCHGAALSVRNDTTLPIKVHQAGIDYSVSHTDSSLFEVTVQPSTWVPFGWADQSASSLITVKIGGNIGAVPLADAQGSVPPCTVDMSTIGEAGTLKLTRPAGTGKGSTPYDTILLTVEAVGGGRVLRATKHLSAAGRKALGNQGKANLALMESAKEVEDISSRKDVDIIAPADYRDFIFNLHIKSIGISLIAERPIRREFLSAFIDGIDVRLWRRMDNRHVKNFTTSLEFTVSDLQVDNYSETVVRPVILHSYSASRREVKKLARRRKNSQEVQSNLAFPDDHEEPTGTGDASGERDLPFILFSAVQELPRGSTTPIYKYVALRILEIKLAVDSSTLQLYYCDLHGDLIGEVRGKNLAESAPEIWVKSYNKKVVADQMQLLEKPGVDLTVALKAAQESKVYFETLILHPIKIRLSFAPTKYPRRKQPDNLSVEESRIFKIIHNVAAIDDLVIKIKSFIVNNAMESAETLGNRILVKVVRDLLIHLVEIAGKVFGSLEAVGKPAGLYRNIGDGVKDFFYEPYEGMMHSPKGFLKGLGKGTGSLFSGVARGAIISTAAIVSSASKGVAVSVGAVSGDRDFLRIREEQRRLASAAGGGVIAGVRAGGESVIAGFTSGISGLVTKPMEEGKKTGALGVIKGIGLGFAGALTKPVLGVTEGIASVAHGVTNQIADVIIIANVRPRRAFERSATDQGDLVLVPLDLAAAKAQEFVNRAGLKGKYSDTFIAHITVDGSKHGAFTPNVDPVAAAKGVKMVASSGSGKDEAEYVVSSVVISEMYVFLLRKDASLHARYSFGVISHCVMNAAQLIVELVLYQDFAHGAPVTGEGMNEELLVSIKCKNKVALSKLYSALSACALRMGNPSGVVPMNVALSSKGRSESSNALDTQDDPYDYTTNKKGNSHGKHINFGVGSSGGGSQHHVSSVPEVDGHVSVVIDGYRFGTANSMTLPPITLTENEILRRAELRFTDVSHTHAHTTGSSAARRPDQRGRGESKSGPPAAGKPSAGIDINTASPVAAISRVLDERMWQTIVEWRINHKKLTHSRCCATLVFNRSESPVQILKVDVLEGRNVTIFGVNPGSGGYDVDSRTIMSGGGAAVVFAYGFLPTPIDHAHVKVRIVTSAFSAVVSTRANRTTCEPVGGYTAGYLEKSLTENWAKYAILVL